MPSAIEFARSQQARFLEELKSLLRIPSISTLPEHAADVRRAAESLARELERIGLEHVRVIETSGIRWYMGIGCMPPASPPASPTVTTTSSPPTRWTSGFPLRLSPPNAMAISMLGARLMTRDRCTAT
jgi:hypothetical protein